MHQAPSISIIIPSFNAGSFVRSCLDSIGAQTFNNYEVLIVDGLSTDDTLQVIQSYTQSDSRIRCVSEKDSGTYDAMNKRIEKATEGAEWELLADKPSLVNIRAVTMKYHLWANQESSVESVIHKLNELSFRIISNNRLSGQLGLIGIKN